MNANDILDDLYREIRPALGERLKKIPRKEAEQFRKREIVLNLRTGSARFADRFGEKLLYSKVEAAEILGGISLMSVNRYVKQGLLPSVQLGGRRLIPRAGLVEMIAEQTDRRGH